MNASRWSGRLRHNAVLLLAGAAAAAAVWSATPSPDALFRASLTTGYVGLALLALTLMLGPLAALRRRVTPISTDLRRDTGLWACAWSLTHVVLGLQVHLRGKMWQYFFYPTPETAPLWTRVRHDLFGFANHTGLVAALLLVLLALLSNDVSVRRLGASRWKNWQRLNYLLFALAVAHSIGYQCIEKRKVGYLVAFGAITLGAVTMQIARAVARSRPSEMP